MMGEQTVAQQALFYEFGQERRVPADHLLRSIDRFVGLSGIRKQLRPFYSECGRPSPVRGRDVKALVDLADCRSCLPRPDGRRG